MRTHCRDLVGTRNLDECRGPRGLSHSCICIISKINKLKKKKSTTLMALGPWALDDWMDHWSVKYTRTKS